MHYAKLNDLRWTGTRQPDFMLVPPPADSAAVPKAAASARVHHAALRSLQEFLDRAGFTELDRPPEPALAAELRRTCWSGRGGRVAGVVPGAGSAVLVDLLERGLAAVVHGALSRAYGDLASLRVDLDRLKYLHLPARRVVWEDASAAWGAALVGSLSASRPLPAGPDAHLLTTVGEPVLLVRYTDSPDDGSEAAPVLLEARLLLPGAGLVATASLDGSFQFDIAALERFLCVANVAVLARPALV